MAGLLDGLVGDNTVKDEAGMTQADRRDPIWSGLIRAGLLAVAGGGNVMPETRAKYLAEAGGALAGIPSDMVANASAHAQQQLKGQQVAAGKAKLATQQRMMDWAASEEGRAMLSKLPEAAQFAAKVALDSGDVDAFQRAVTGAETNQLKSELGLAKLEAARAKAEGAGPYKGTSEVAQHLNYLKTADPSSYEYWAAYNFFSVPRKLQDGTEMGKQNLVGLPVPTFKDPRLTKENAQTPDQIGQQLEKGEEKVLEDGTKIFKDSAGTVRIDYTDAPSTIQRPNEPKVVVQPQKVDPVEARKLNEFKVTQAQVQDVARDFLTQWKNMSTADRIKAVSGQATDAGSAWALLASILKGPSILNLGVLTGGDRDFITQLVADPTRLNSLTTDHTLVTKQVERVLRSLDVAAKTHENNMLNPPKAKVGSAPKPGEATEYVDAKGQPVTEDDIQTTMRENNLTREQVIARLKRR